MMKVITSILRKIIYHCSGFSPRMNKAVLGSYKDQFSDNAKYLCLHWQQTRFIRAIWISGDASLIKQLREEGIEAYHRRSLRGLYHCLTSKYYFYNTYIGDINQYVAKGAIKTNLWHGSPLKKIEFDIESGPLAHIYHAVGPLGRVLNSMKFHQQHITPDIMLSPSPVIDPLFISAFRITPQQVIRSGNPRTDYHRRYPNQKKSLKSIFNVQYNQVILYVPTCHDVTQTQGNNSQIKSQASSLSQSEMGRMSHYDKGFDWPRLSKQLQQNNQLFLIRFHPNEAHLGKQLSQYPNIIDISSWQDVYSTLHEVNLLITDQSSLFVDLLLYRVPILFYRFNQVEESIQLREAYDYAECLPLVGGLSTSCNSSSNRTVHTFPALLEVLNKEESFLIDTETEKEYRLLQQIYWQTEDNDAFSTIENEIIGRDELAQLKSIRQ
ncbi:CDP-glycerol glycerophosphotransferase family protein [Shewanella canadensis]|uniref:CDP-glycerol glycerophosphotransferase family protein n=2 Tax=Shewanella canadensis TaxID=271096 RepID=A0A431WNE3_9GAMM|nr:CDP-glycerol glycerophosphotransferase family protein [Shewanella canadensis]